MSALTQPALLTPGSAKAIWRGCKCDALANNFGRGFPGRFRIEFRTTYGCPMHDETMQAEAVR